MVTCLIFEIYPIKVTKVVSSDLDHDTSWLKNQMRFVKLLSCDLEPDITSKFMSSDIDPDTSIFKNQTRFRSVTLLS